MQFNIENFKVLSYNQKKENAHLRMTDFPDIINRRVDNGPTVYIYLYYLSLVIEN